MSVHRVRAVNVARTLHPDDEDRRHQRRGVYAVLDEFRDEPEILPKIAWLAQLYAAGAELTEEHIRRAARTVKVAVVSERKKYATAVVYYVRVGDRCKIGTTVNLQSRMQSLCPEEILATEPGSYAVESRRHKQFARLRTAGEWFEYRDELVEHVERLRA